GRDVQGVAPAAPSVLGSPAGGGVRAPIQTRKF
ncbi:MAG: hypothetical protein FD140_4847, partial [Limisphaerales bacterium]